MNRTMKVPGPDHPITIEPSGRRMVVIVAGTTIADTVDALMLRESSYPAVAYIPRKDFDMARLQRTDHTTYCPYKGDCSYFSIPAAGARGVNAVWSYEAPFDAVVAIKDHLAFYTDRAEIVVESR